MFCVKKNIKMINNLFFVYVIIFNLYINFIYLFILINYFLMKLNKYHRIK